MSYKTMGYNLVQRIIANLDKMSKNNESKTCYSPWGIFKMYRSSKRGRFYSVSGSTVLHNGGGYKIGSFRRLLAKFS